MKEFKCGNFSLPIGNKTYIMGILNVTPDSFSDGGKYSEINSALSHAEKMICEGADIIDVGAVSTRPFSDYVSAEEEWERLRDVLREIRKSFNVPVSVDTFNPDTAEKCLDMGADIINDVSGIISSEMAELIKKYGSGWVIMHGGIKINKTEDICDYPDGIVNDVNSFFSSSVNELIRLGIKKESICLDAGFGFAKTASQNKELLKNFDMLDNNGCPLLCGLSRKRFIGELSGESDSSFRTGGTLAANVFAASKGADIIRVHEIELHKKALQTIDRLIKL